MSVKTKLSIMISFIVLILLVLNVILNECSTRLNLRADIEKDMVQISQLIASSVIQYSTEEDLLQTAVNERLQRASLAVSMRLNGELDSVAISQLGETAKEVGVTHISLLTADGSGGYRTLYSSNSSEIGKIKQRDNQSDYFLPDSQKSDLPIKVLLGNGVFTRIRNKILLLVVT